VSESTTNPGAPLDHAALVAVFDQFAAMDRYSYQRDEILEQLLGVTYSCEIEFGSSERTYGYTPDDRFRDGRTVLGQLKGSMHKVSVQMPTDQNDRVEALASGDTLLQAAVFMSWSSIYDRYELQADPATAAVEDVASPPPSGPTSEPVTSETVANEAAGPEPPAPEPSAPVAEPVVEPTVQPSSSPVTPAPPTPSPSVPEWGSLSATDRNAFLDADQPLTSASLIEFLASGLQLQVQQVTAVVDGFWDYVLQPEHYGRQKQVIPNFGTFSYGTQAGQPALVFQSKSTRQLLAQQSKGWNHVASERWIRYYQATSDRGDLSGLSVKRRMSVWIAERTGESLAIVHRVLWELMSLVCDLMAEGKRSIRWAMRGEMFPRETQLKGEDQPQMRYAFRTYGRLAKKLVSPIVQSKRKPALASLSIPTGLKSLLNPGNYFRGPGTLRRAAVDGVSSPGGSSSSWFSLRWWGLPLAFVLCMNLVSWPYSTVGGFSLQLLIGMMTLAMPLALSVIFFVLGGILLSLTGQQSDRLLLWTFRFFMVMSVFIGLMGLVVAVAFRCLDWLAGLAY
jgi:nucleoid DNA-binding protein